MELRYFILRRVLLLVPTIFGLVTLVFIIIWSAPENDWLSPYLSIKGISHAEALKKIEQQLHWYPGNPLLTYFYYLRDLLVGQWGYMGGTNSVYQGNPINGILLFFPNTIQLALGAIILSLVVSLPLGTYIGSKPNSAADQIGRVFSLAGYAMPAFWLAYLLIALFGDKTGYLLPVVPWGGNGLTGSTTAYTGNQPWIHATQSGLYTTPTHVLLIDALLGGSLKWFLIALEYLILPVLTLTYGILAGLLRFIRAGMVDASNQEYVKTARAKGVPERLIIKRHIRKNALIPAVTVFGLLFAGLLSGAVTVELVFTYYGLGYFIVESSIPGQLQVWAIMAGTIVFGLLLVTANLIVDVIYAYIDPRIRY